MPESYWRNRASPIIARVIRETGTVDMKALRKALKAAYPFQVRKYHPYKIWLDEVKRQLKKKPPLGTKLAKTPISGQRTLFQ